MTVSGSIIQDIIRFAETYGVSRKTLCMNAGIAVSCTPNERVDGEIVERVWREAIRLTRDKYFGLHLGNSCNLSALNIVGYVMANCATLKEGIEKVCEYATIISDGLLPSLEVTSSTAILKFSIVHVPGNYIVRMPREPIESSMAFAVRACEILTGKPFLPQKVLLQYEATQKHHEYKKIFGAPVVFGQDINAIVFQSSKLELPILSANEELMRVFEQHAKLYQSKINTKKHFADKVKAILYQSVQKEIPACATVARMVNMSVRSVHRKLESEGTSYRALLNAVHYNMAKFYLADSSMTIAEIAFLLGFSDTTAFHRAFKRWTGKTPNEVRNTMKK